ncbi:MAG TPA: hypothetical protein VLJ68_04925 [Chitinophagaceae bacterium]|nr:hypothetical protein [Chitinophagaceae bacterium]
MKQRFNPAQFLTLILFFSLLMIFSCVRENSQTSIDAQETEASMASSEADGEAETIFSGIFDDVMGTSDEVGMQGIGVFGRGTATGSGRPFACFTVTVTHTGPNAIGFPVRVVIDFGTAGCTSLDGHTRKGKIITEYTGRLIFAGSVASTTFDGFYIDGIHVEGTHRVENTSTPNSTPASRQFTFDIINARLTKPNGNYTEWNSHKVATQIEGLATLDYPRDDVFRLEGASHGRTQRGNLLVAWESAITEPLIKKFNCHWITKGKVRITRVNAAANSPWIAVIEFGNGDCDNQAVITINGVAHQITLH